ncbi:hypothetical protein EWB00_008820 [Schistosoma japonicum]|uniref:Uncharacterized protein n=1 Tax=Schistosoma japonicum TaxID=6182 RepID=A0A4Z2CP81_SCHJA|nr:hypothetical protein EWB00_008820 [Schistosoma japonicum]
MSDNCLENIVEVPHSITTPSSIGEQKHLHSSTSLPSSHHPRHSPPDYTEIRNPSLKTQHPLIQASPPCTNSLGTKTLSPRATTLTFSHHLGQMTNE